MMLDGDGLRSPGNIKSSSFLLVLGSTGRNGSGDHTFDSFHNISDTQLT